MKKLNERLRQEHVAAKIGVENGSNDRKEILI